MFQEQQPAASTAPGITPQVTTPAVPQELADLVGEGRKYQSIEVALQSIKPAQDHIARLEQENATLRAEVVQLKADLSARETLQQTLATMATPAQAASAPTGGVDVAAQVKLVLEQERAVERTLRNTQEVEQKLTAVYGSKAAEVFAAKGRELGVDLVQLSAQSPAAVLALFDKPSPVQQPAFQSLTTIPTQPRSTAKSFAEITAELNAKYQRG
jgi:hypothetical protein